MLVIANKSYEPADVVLPENLAKETWQPVLMNDSGKTPAPDAPMAPWECRIYAAK